MLELTVFLSGALVMVLEMVGSRILAPHVGTSAVVWTSLIGVILACLALGAWAGGRWADRKTSPQGLALALLGAGLGTALTALLHGLIAGIAVTQLGNLYLAAVAAALGLFALPAFFFGMITPYAIRLRLAGLDSAGATVGRLYALSTAGSILGTFLGGFALISFFGSSAILWGTALLMLCLAWLNDPGLGRRLLPVFLLCLTLAALDAGFTVWQEGHSGAHLVESPYNSIRIQDGLDMGEGSPRPVRLMATNPGYQQSGMLIDAPADLYIPYTRWYALGPRLVPEAKKVLMLGGGGYSVPKWLLAGKSRLDADSLLLTVVELDPAMTYCARKWFALPDDPRLTIRHEDARAFLNRQQDQFDLLFVDVFNSHYSVPFQMGTVEAARALRRAIAPTGAVVMNVISAITGPDGRLFRSIYGALQTAFPEVRVYPVNAPDDPGQVQNLMLVALPEAGRPEIPAASPAASGAVPDANEVAAMLTGRYQDKIPRDVPPLTDNFAPVERYALMLLR